MGDVDIEDLIPEEQCVLTKTENGFIKRLPADTYNVQHRGGRGITGMTTRDDDTVENMFVCSSHDYIMLFSNLGRMYRIKGNEYYKYSAPYAERENYDNIASL